MRTRIPQFELPTADLIFNLASETTQDGAKLMRERELASQRAAEAKALEASRQPDLLPSLDSMSPEEFQSF
jgi:hypothetical protein